MNATTATATVGAPHNGHADGLRLLRQHVDATSLDARRLRRPRILVHLMLALVVTAGAWMGTAHIDRVVQTQGRVTASAKQQLVQHLEGGIVAQVKVREGQVVQKGEVLLQVASEQANSSLGEKQARSAGLRARLARLQAEADGADRLAQPPDPALRSEWDSQREAFGARMARLQQGLKVFEEQRAQKLQEARETQARRKGLGAELDTARQQLALVTGMLAKQAASQLEVLEAKARVDRLSTQVTEADTAIPRLEAAAKELEARAAELRAQFRSEARTALADTQVELQRLDKDIGADADRVRRIDVLAPIGGTVNKLYVNTVGGVVRPGETLVEITPVDSGVQIESRVSPAERGALQVGQRTVVKVAAFDHTVYGTLDGRVSEISPDSLTDERGERYFRAVVTVDAAALQAFGQPVTPGMTVSAGAVTGQRTILQALLSPIRGMAGNALREHR